MQNNIKQGLKDGIPIALGYFSVSFTFGMLAVNHGMKPFHAVLISLLNLTSAGQFAGLNVILAGSSLVEMALTQLVINMRYALMSLSLSQKFARSVHTGHRLAIAYGITDEIFAVASTIMPEFIRSALGVALYGMFVAIVIPPAKKEKNVGIVVITALILSTGFYYLPLLCKISDGFKIIICTLLAAGMGAVLFPIREEES